MKQIVQLYKSGSVTLRDVPVPNYDTNQILVRNQFSLISLGTELSMIDLGKKSLIGKAMSRPELVKRMWEKAKQEGVANTLNLAMNRLDNPVPLGYSSMGTIVECGISATEFSPGDRVACVGHTFASHAEFVAIPVNLACRVPDKVAGEEASFGMLGSISLHGIRSAHLTFGANVVVMGLGLLGMLTAQILRAYGCDVILFDPDSTKVDVAKKLHFEHAVCQSDDLIAITRNRTDTQGVDAVIITASTKSSEPVNSAIRLCRQNGKIVVVGVVDIHPDRNALWEKEIELTVSKAAGPGSLDPSYEIDGVSFPIGDIRWPLKRNLREFLRLLEQKRIDLQPLITHRYPFSTAESVFHDLISEKISSPIGVLLDYPSNSSVNETCEVPLRIKKTKKSSEISIGVIGAGLFGKSVLLPIIKKTTNLNMHTLVTRSGISSEHSGRKFGFQHLSTNDDTIWHNNDIDAVFGFTPHRYHADLILKAFNSHKALFLEKPLCISLDQLDEIRDKYSQLSSAPLLMIGHNRRFSPHIKQLVQWLSKRQDPIVVQYRINVGYLPANSWVHKEKEGRSRIVGEMSHFIDLLRYLTNSTPVRVWAERVSGNNSSIINNDNVIIFLKFNDGSIASITYTGTGCKSYSREMIEIFSDNMTLVSKDFRLTQRFYSGKKENFKTSQQEIGYRQEIQHFIDCVVEKLDPTVTIEEMISTMDVIFAIEHVLATGKCKDLT